ncbi:MAG: YbhB/YbcL family Raf kinase inhibitor-like protein [Candidatus Glassbacteria bacterium]|nr:YbhB/YbcL family Raf kinase inhibitor-like protein [Candidatus Glassbacteria bacterium]
MSIQLTSPAFEQGEMIPDRYTCKGQDISPALNWVGLPEGTHSLALVFDDPDAPMGIWVHWVIYNIPADSSGLPENVPASKPVLSGGAAQGTNSWGRIGYGGPCPPSGTHRYYFRLYALDNGLELKPGATKAQLLKAMESHVLAECELMGRYAKR